MRRLQTNIDLPRVSTLVQSLADQRHKVGSRVAFPQSVATTKRVRQAAHGFAVGDVLKLSGSSYAKAKADTAANAQVVGIVGQVLHTEAFVLVSKGLITGLSGLTAGARYYLSAATAGAMTSTSPNIPSIVLDAVSTTSGIVCPFVADWVELDTCEGGLPKKRYFLCGPSH